MSPPDFDCLLLLVVWTNKTSSINRWSQAVSRPGGRDSYSEGIQAQLAYCGLDVYTSIVELRNLWRDEKDDGLLKTLRGAGRVIGRQIWE